ncbi:MAG: serpin family protein [Bacteroidales bacterium]|jgi:serpin B|nr:serpin family protein [Bacteroidales bacterium]
MKNTLKILLFCTLFAACDKNENETTVKTPPINIELNATEIQLNNVTKNFALDFFATSYSENTDKENIVLSPFSLSMALAMLLNGADTETEQAIRTTMAFDSYSFSQVNEYFKKIWEALYKTDKSTTLAIANSIWTDKGFPVKQSFYDVNKNWYNAEAKELDFNSPSAVGTINKWCSDNTNGLIKKIINELSGKMYLLNALYFKGIWAEGYLFETNETKPLPFYKADGTSVSVNMMHQKKGMKYYSDDHLSLASLPYGNGAFSMLFILPNNGVMLDEVVVQLKTPGYFETIINNSHSGSVELFVPRFKIEYETSLKSTLESLGMGIAFDSNLADFSKLTDVPFFVTMVKQKAYIEVNEKGTEAAAVTVVGLETSIGGYNQFKADHPFLFMIQENSTGTVLFMGKVGNPQ